MNELCIKCRLNPRRYQGSRLGSYCNECHAAYQREYAKKTGYKDSKLRHDRLRNIIIAGKQKPCADCTKEYPWYVMDYDHVRGIKEFDLSKAASMRLSEIRILNEIAKCEVVCSNCHLERT